MFQSFQHSNWGGAKNMHKGVATYFFPDFIHVLFYFYALRCPNFNWTVAKSPWDSNKSSWRNYSVSNFHTVSRNTHLDSEGHLMKPSKKTLLPSVSYRHWMKFLHLVSFLSSGATYPWLRKPIKLVNSWDTKQGFGRYTLAHIYFPPPKKLTVLKLNDLFLIW